MEKFRCRQLNYLADKLPPTKVIESESAQCAAELYAMELDANLADPHEERAIEVEGHGVFRVLRKRMTMYEAVLLKPLPKVQP